MVKPITVIFVALSALLAITHYVAGNLSLYWYWPWFDILMHSWGGVLIGLGIHSLATFSRLHFRPSLKIVVPVALIFVVSWEVFERTYGLFDPAGYWADTITDMMLGLLGATLTHIFLQHLNKNAHE